MLQNHTPICQFQFHSIKVSWVRETETCRSSSQTCLVMNSRPHYSILFTSSYWCAYYKWKLPFKSFDQQSKNFSSFLVIWQKCTSLGTTISLPIWLNPILKWVSDLPSATILEPINGHLTLFVKVPSHSAWRHVPFENTINLSTYCTPNTVLVLNLHLKAFFVETMICAFTH